MYLIVGRAARLQTLHDARRRLLEDALLAAKAALAYRQRRRIAVGLMRFQRASLPRSRVVVGVAVDATRARRGDGGLLEDGAAQSQLGRRKAVEELLALALVRVGGADGCRRCGRIVVVRNDGIGNGVHVSNAAACYGFRIAKTRYD